MSQLELVSVGDKTPNWGPAADRGLWALSDPRLSNPSQDEKEVLLWSEELGSICSSPFPSPTHLWHTININPFENKVWEIYFYIKTCVRSFIEVRNYVWLCSAYICICIRLYNSYTWRYNEVLEIFAEVLKIYCSSADKALNNITNRAIHYVKEGNSSNLSQKISIDYHFLMAKRTGTLLPI